MNGTKVMWAQLVLVFLLILAGVWAATEWTAWRLAFQPQLGQPWFMVGDWPVYPPFAFFWWWFAFDAYAPGLFLQGAAIAVSGAAIAAIASMALSVWRARESRDVTTYGSARWAKPHEVAKAGLLGDQGVVLGRYRGAYLRHDGPEHVLCFAPTRSGKGVGLVVPSLLTWPGSLIVHDLKGENWQLTFGAQLREWLKTLRKKNASVVFATQSLADVETSAIAPSIIESCPTRIFLPNDRGQEPQIAAAYSRFGLNARQIEILSRAIPKRDYYCQSRQGNRLFELGLGEVALAFCAASSKADQLQIADLLERHGSEGFGAAWLQHHGLTWAADLLRLPLSSSPQLETSR